MRKLKLKTNLQLGEAAARLERKSFFGGWKALAKKIDFVEPLH